jgi:hypothetical protein
MDSPLEIARKVVPDLIRRTGGGWLAVAPKGAIFSIGVTAATQEEARENFCSAFARWIEIQKLDVPKKRR